jgi:hypothetical protein
MGKVTDFLVLGAILIGLFIMINNSTKTSQVISAGGTAINGLVSTFQGR